MTQPNNDETAVAASAEHDDEHTAGLDRALAQSQRLERDERNADIARSQSADERIVRALAKE